MQGLGFGGGAAEEGRRREMDPNRPPRPRHPGAKRKNDMPTIVITGKDLESARELAQIKKKIKKLAAKHSMAIRCSAKYLSDAYDCLGIFSDPRGFKLRYSRQGDSYDPDRDMQYLELLWRLVNSNEIRVDSRWLEGHTHACKIASDLFMLTIEDIDECLLNYDIIYGPEETVVQWKGIENFLLDPNSESEYNKDPNSFKEKLSMKSSLLARSEEADVLKAFVSWWTSKSKRDEEIARKILSDGYKEAKEFNDGRCKVDFTRGDYLKLKFDVAVKVGIIKSIPVALEDFHLPGLHKWSADDF